MSMEQMKKLALKTFSRYVVIDLKQHSFNDQEKLLVTQSISKSQPHS